MIRQVTLDVIGVVGRLVEKGGNMSIIEGVTNAGARAPRLHQMPFFKTTSD